MLRPDNPKTSQYNVDTSFYIQQPPFITTAPTETETEKRSTFKAILRLLRVMSPQQIQELYRHIMDTQTNSPNSNSIPKNINDYFLVGDYDCKVFKLAVTSKDGSYVLRYKLKAPQGVNIPVYTIPYNTSREEFMQDYEMRFVSGNSMRLRLEEYLDSGLKGEVNYLNFKEELSSISHRIPLGSSQIWATLCIGDRELLSQRFIIKFE